MNFYKKKPNSQFSQISWPIVLTKKQNSSKKNKHNSWKIGFFKFVKACGGMDVIH